MDHTPYRDHKKYLIDEGGSFKNKEEPVDVKDIDVQVSQVLVSKGKASDEFFLVLQGKVEVVSGSEGFTVQLSTFSYFGLDALLTDNFNPDFTA